MRNHGAKRKYDFMTVDREELCYHSRPEKANFRSSSFPLRKYILVLFEIVSIKICDIIYARYSSERQTEQSIEGQLHVCNDYAKRNELVIVGTYIDRAMTGTNDNREDFQRMLKDSDKRSFDYVLVTK